MIVRVDVPAFTPSFTYNYLCGSTLLSIYLPVYFYIYIIQIIFIPFTSYLTHNILPYSKLSLPIKLNFPGILWPDYWLQEENKNQSNQEKSLLTITTTPRVLYNGDNFANKFMQDIVVLITFGLCCPILCLAISLSIFLSILEFHCIIGYFISTKITHIKKISSEIPLQNNNTNNNTIAIDLNDNELNLSSNVISDLSNDILLQTIQYILSQIMKLCCDLVWIVIWTSCFFFIFLCWDIAGDEVGLENSIWVPIVAFGICLIGYFMNNKLYSCFYQQTKEKITIDSSSTEFTLSSIHSPVSPTQNKISSSFSLSSS